MKHKLKSLSIFLKSQGFHKLSQVVKQLDNAPQLDEPIEIEEDWEEEAAKEFGAEPISEEEYLAQNLTYPLKEENLHRDSREYLNLYKQIISKEGLQTVAANGRSPVLGQGGFGLVVNLIYNGKPAAAKIGIDADLDNELENWKTIQSSLDKFTPEQRKHIPNIYAILEGEVVRDGNKYFDDIVYNYYVIVMEKLKPLSAQLTHIITGIATQTKQSMNLLLKDEEYLYEVSKDLIKKLSERFADSSKQKSPSQEISEAILTISPKDILQLILKYLRASNPNKYVANASFNVLYTELTYFIIDKVKPLVNDIENKTQSINFNIKTILGGSIEVSSGFPSRYNEFSAEQIRWKHIPEVKNYFELLQTLSKDFNMAWDDVVTKNIMQGDDGNLKLIDIGLYKEPYKYGD